MAGAQGARAQMALEFETTYGLAPAGGFTRMPFASTTLGAEQPLLDLELLGYGRDPLAPTKDTATADGDVVVPLDAIAFGIWLKAEFGAPTSTGTGPWTHEFQLGAWTLPSVSIETGTPEVPHCGSVASALARNFWREAVGPPPMLIPSYSRRVVDPSLAHARTHGAAFVSRAVRARWLRSLCRRA